MFSGDNGKSGCKTAYNINDNVIRLTERPNALKKEEESL